MTGTVPDNLLEHPKKRSKEERYDWKMLDKPGTFMMLPKHALKIDYSYQRGNSEQRIIRLAAEWSWVGCGAIIVALRDNGDWFVVDGQHRVLAACKRTDIKEVPCLVYEVGDISDEALHFLRCNTNRKAPSMVQKFNAVLMTDDHAGRVANELVLMSGRKVMSGSGPGAFAAVASLVSCIQADEAAMRRVWPILVELCGPDTTHKITQHLIIGMWYLERHLKEGVSLSQSHWRKRIVQAGYQAVEDSIVTAANYAGGGKNMVNSARGIIRIINKGLRHHLPHTLREETNDE